MTDTSLEYEAEEKDVEDEIEEIYRDDVSLYVEKETRVLYEVKFFDDFCFVRPAAPMLYRNIQKLDLFEFTLHFDEFEGDHEFVKSFLRDGGSIEIEVT